MTKVILLSVFLFVQSTMAFATNSEAEAKAKNRSQGQAQAQTQGQAQSQGQLQGQNQGQSVQTSNSVSTNITGDNFDIPVASSYAPSMSPSAQCMGVASGGVQTMGFGFSMGKSYESKPCNQRELVRVLHSLNQDTAAIEVACSIEGAEVTTLCKGLKEVQ